MKKIISLVLVGLVAVAAFAMDKNNSYDTRVGYGEELVAKLREQYDCIERTATTEDMNAAAMEFYTAQSEAEAEGKVLIWRTKSLAKEAEHNNEYYVQTPTDYISMWYKHDRITLFSIDCDAGVQYQIWNLPAMSDSEYFKIAREVKSNKIKKDIKQTEAGKQKQKDDAAANAPATVVGIGLDAIIFGASLLF